MGVGKRYWIDAVDIYTNNGILYLRLLYLKPSFIERGSWAGRSDDILPAEIKINGILLKSLTIINQVA
jgi:hypothetical protein